jgi:hypothetical protein
MCQTSARNVDARMKTQSTTRCMDPGRLLQLRQLIENVIDVLDKENITPEMAQMIKVYLLGQGRRSMEDITHMHSRFLPVATAINNLGWDCFIEGRIPYLLIKRVQPMLRRDNPRGSVDLWGSRFIKSLISIMHKQWLYRNSNVHQESKGLNAKQHQELTSRIQELISMKKESLLKRHQYLMDVDFVQLGSSPTITRQVWVVNVEMAISVVKVAWGNFCSQEVIKVLRTPQNGKPQYQE